MVAGAAGDASAPVGDVVALNAVTASRASAPAVVGDPDRMFILLLGDIVEVLRNDDFLGHTGAIVELCNFNDGVCAYKLSCGGWYTRDEVKFVRSGPVATPLSPGYPFS